MNFLILGSGGREHAFAWKLSQSTVCDRLYIAPGNAGTARCGQNIDTTVTDFEGIKKICLEKKIDIVIPGPEVPLVLGVADYFKEDNELKHIPVIGPGKSGALLEGSKSFAKDFMLRHKVPTAAYEEFEKKDLSKGIAYIREQAVPIVLKADGLAAGKGVLICQSQEEAVSEFKQMLDGKFGEAGNKVVIEQFLDGIELSVFVLTDGKDYVVLPEAKDYKNIGEGDTGLNTGGMGAVSPVPFADAPFMRKVEETIIKPTVRGIKEDRLDYKGFIFFGLIKVEGEPYVIEYNCRMGDPETQVVFPRIKNDVGILFQAVAEGSLAGQHIETDPRKAVTTILVSGGYPEKYEKGKVMKVPQTVEENQYLFYAGVKEEEGKLKTNGGRVIAATALSENFDEVRSSSRDLASKIDFEGAYYRKDIGWEFQKEES